MVARRGKVRRHEALGVEEHKLICILQSMPNLTIGGSEKHINFLLQRLIGVPVTAPWQFERTKTGFLAYKET